MSYNYKHGEMYALAFSWDDWVKLKQLDRKVMLFPHISNIQVLHYAKMA